MKRLILTTLLSIFVFAACITFGQNLNTEFKNPTSNYRPIAFWHINGEMTTKGVREQVIDAYQKDGFGGVAVLPLRPYGKNPGTLPEYLSKDYFDRYEDILKCSKEQNTQVILYDDIDYPSGSVNGKFRELYPEMTSKQLSMREFDVSNGKTLKQNISLKGKNLGTVAMNTKTFEVFDISDHVKDSIVNWTSPEGSWKVMSFVMEYNIGREVDYLDPNAVDKFIAMTYDQYATKISSYFGNTIQYSFFDDVGFYTQPRTWTEAMTDLYEKRTGQKALLALPALWYYIGENTTPIRIVFFDIRAELIRDGYVRRVAEWNAQHNMKSMGHPPGNYEPTGVGAHGDILKYYKYTQIPLMDAIHGYGYGRPGYKLVTSAADLYDRPLVAAEIYGNYNPNMDSTQMYQSAMEVFTRGVNFLVLHGMWYDTSSIKISPLISHYSKLLGPALHGYSDWAARSMTLLREGRRISEIAVLWPINTLEAWFGFDKRKVGAFNDVPPETDYRKISDMLTGEIRRDFTFVHPEYLATNLYVIEKGKLILNNKNTRQEYGIIILPSLRIESVTTLQKIKAFYEQGGKVIATGILPSKSVEFGKDKEVIALVKSIFNIDPANLPTTISKEENRNKGVAVFLPKADKVSLEAILSDLEVAPDVQIKDVSGLYEWYDGTRIGININGAISEANNRFNTMGMLSYIHKEMNGKQIYFFANSTKKPVDTWVTLRGKLKIEKWNPYNGEIKNWENVTYIKNETGQVFTRFPLRLDEVKSIFAIGDTLMK
jgi:hypothetical protein